MRELIKQGEKQRTMYLEKILVGMKMVLTSLARYVFLLYLQGNSGLLELPNHIHGSPINSVPKSTSGGAFSWSGRGCGVLKIALDRHSFLKPFGLTKLPD